MADEHHFEFNDLFIIAGIASLSGAGYLCDQHSPTIQPFLGLFGGAFSAALVMLGFLLLRDAVVYREKGWLAGLLFVVWPFIAWLFIWIGKSVLSFYER